LSLFWQYLHNRIAIIIPNGNVIHFAGNGASGDTDEQADKAQCSTPRGMVTLPDRDILVCDYSNDKVTKIVRE